MALAKFIVFKKFLVWQSSLGQQHRLPAPMHCVSTLVFPSVCGPFCCFFSSSLLCSYQLSSRAASTSAGSGLPPLSLLVLQHQVDVHLVRCVQFSPALMFRVRCLGSIYGEWRFQVTLFSGPFILQAPGEGFSLGGSRFQGCHGYLPSG